MADDFLTGSFVEMIKTNLLYGLGCLLNRISKAVLVLLLLVFHQNLKATSSEEKLKAAYIYQFAKFSQLPIQSDQIVIGIVGKKSLVKSFDVINQKMIANKKIEIVWISKPEQLSGCCSIVFFANDVKNLSRDYLQISSNNAILTVLDFEYDESYPGIIRLVKRGAKLKFVVNNKLANSQSIKFSTFLLQVAIKVE